MSTYKLKEAPVNEMFTLVLQNIFMELEYEEKRMKHS